MIIEWIVASTQIPRDDQNENYNTVLLKSGSGYLCSGIMPYVKQTFEKITQEKHSPEKRKENMMNDQPNQMSRSSNIDAEQMEQIPLDTIETSAEDREQQILNDDALETITGGAPGIVAVERFEHEAAQASGGSLRDRWNGLPTAYRAEGIASTVVGPATALAVGIAGGVIANKA